MELQNIWHNLMNEQQEVCMLLKKNFFKKTISGETLPISEELDGFMVT